MYNVLQKNVVSNLTSAMVTIIIVSVWFYLEYHDSNIKPCIKIITSIKLLPFFFLYKPDVLLNFIHCIVKLYMIVVPLIKNANCIFDNVLN